MMSTARRYLETLTLAATVLLLAAMCPAARAATVLRIENAAPIEDHSDRAIERAIERAVEHSMRGATSLGLSSIELEDAVVQGDRVLVGVVARDAAADAAQDDRGDEEVSVIDIASAPEPR